MPYGISQNQSDCNGWATVKQVQNGYETIGCHVSKQDAIDNMVAASITEDIEPIGEVRALPSNYRPALADDVPEGRACGNCAYYDESNQDETATKAYCTRWNEYVDGAFYCNAWQPYEDEEEDEEEYEEDRAVNLSAPQFMRANAKRGLKYHEEGLSGDGLKPQTVEDARSMAAGNVTEAKWRKIAPWIARHMVDLEAEGVKEGDITAGMVAHLLWGSGTTKSEATRAMEYAERVVGQLEEQRAPAPKKDQIFGSEKNPAGSASDKEGKIELGDAVEKSLQTKASEHNARMKEESRPDWTRVGVGSLRSVWRRGAGAFSTSHRPNMTRAQWAMARVNAFLYLSEKGKPENPNYKQDNDLLNSGHPKFSDSRTALSSFDNIRNTMTETNTINWVVRDETETRRVAFSNMEVRASEDGTKLIGYAAVFDSPSEPLPFTEFVRRGAFTKTLNDGADVRLLIDHEGVPLARTKSGTLVLTEDDRGLLVESDLDPMNPDAARLISALRRGDISQMSFAFRTVKDNWSDDRRTRELREVQLFDVSVVTFPAYESTVAELRAKQDVATIIATNTLSLRKRQIEIARHK
jgi:HK97 family phage prohead protease